MISNLHIISAEIPIVNKIIDDECWYEGERRNMYVPRDDKIVQEHVIDIIIHTGHTIREEAIINLKGHNNERS